MCILKIILKSIPKPQFWLLTFIYLCLSSNSASGFTSRAAGTTINSYASVTNISEADISVNDGSVFSTGDHALLIQMKGATVSRQDNANHGDITTYGEAGRFEFVDVASVNNNTVTLTSSPSISFNTSAAVQLVRVPVYNSQTLSGTVSAVPWNGSTGGVLAIDATGTLTLSGTLDVTGQGYRGGALASTILYDGCVSDQTNYTGPIEAGTGNKGEGIVIDENTHLARRGHNANGGGGGNITDAGGGGGANYGAGGLGGRELDLCDDDGHFGGLGGQSLDYTPMNRLFLGGGGGSGSEIQQDPFGGPRSGGGIVVIRAKKIISNEGKIYANGLDANDDVGNGADGGGAGGAVAIATLEGITGALDIEINGGNGGSESNTEYAHGTGGGGGGGALLLRGLQCTDVNWMAARGVAGVSDLGSGAGDPHWGATDGGDGQCMSPFNALPQLAPPEGVTLKGRGILQGAYDNTSSLMRDDLRQKNLLPVNHPYAAAPYNHSGAEQLDNTVKAVTGNDAVVDWVLLELRNSTNSGIVLATKAVMVQADGDLIDAETGSDELAFDTLDSGDYFVSLRHRNHLDIITATPVTLSNTAVMVDFTLPGTIVNGTNTRLIQNNTALMWTGDVNASQQIIGHGPDQDNTLMLAKNLTAPGNPSLNANYQLAAYVASDLNLDGISLYAGPTNDLDLLLFNILSFPDNPSLAANYIIYGSMNGL